MLFELDSNNFWIRARWFSLTQLRFRLPEPIQQVVEVADHFHGTLFAELQTLGFALNLLANGIKATIIAGDERFDESCSFAWTTLTQLRSALIDCVEKWPEFG